MQTRVIMAAVVGVAAGALLASCDERPALIDDARMSHAVSSAVLEGTRQVLVAETSAPAPPPVDWSAIFVIEDVDEENDGGAESGEERIVDLDDDLDAATRFWSGVLEGDAAFEEASSEAVPEEGAGEDPLEAPELEDETTAEDVAATVGVAAEPAIEPVDLSWIDEELVILQERIVALELQVEQQRRDIDTMALAMTVQARRVTATENVNAQLAALVASCRP